MHLLEGDALSFGPAKGPCLMLVFKMLSVISMSNQSDCLLSLRVYIYCWAVVIWYLNDIFGLLCTKFHLSLI